MTDLETTVAKQVTAWVEGCATALGDDLRSIVMFGSAAEAQLRATSDINVLVVLRRFDRARIDGMRESDRIAQSEAHLAAMFVLEEELASAMESFAVKFSDILARRRVLFGDDPLAGLSVPRSALAAHARQVLLNLRLRLRQGYVLSSLREEQIAVLIAESAGPLRSAAAAIAILEGNPAPSPKAALAAIVATLGDPALAAAVDRISEARERDLLPSGVAGPALFDLMRLTERLEDRLAATSREKPR